LERELGQLTEPTEQVDRFRRQLRSRLLAQARQRAPRGRARSRRRRLALSPALAAATLATAAIATAAVLLTLEGGRSQEAFAGWSAKPTRATVGHVSAVDAKCAARMAEVSKMPRASKNGVSVSISTEPLLTDTRGPYTLVLYPQTLCFSGPDFVSLSGRRDTEGVAISTAYRDGAPFTIAQGPAAPDASTVMLALDNGSSVQATVVNSSFLAWWPSASRPTSVTVTSPSGTRTEPLSYPAAPTPPATGKTPVQSQP
jgi:hypothetical protein